MRKKILITGGSGFVGRNLILYYEANTDYIINYCDNEVFSIPFESKKSSTVKIKNDFSNFNENDLKVYDALIHLAAVKKHNVEDSFDDLVNTNIVETNNFFRKACRAGVKKIIFSSSLYANGEMNKYKVKESDPSIPSTLYGSSKLFAENVMRELSLEYSDIQFIPLRLYFIYGPHQYYGKGYPSIFTNTLKRLSEGNVAIVKNDGKQELDYLYIDDLCRLIHMIEKHNFENNFEILNASSANSYKVIDIVKYILQRSNQKNNFIYDGVDFTKGTFRSGDNSKANKILGWTPKVSIEAGIDKFIEWFSNVKP